MGDQLAGKVALLTGGGGGLGSGCAAALARDGARVFLMGRTPATLDAVAERIRGEVPGAPADTVGTVAGDATNEDDVRAAVDRVCREAGGLDITVATVGGATIAPLLVHTAASFLNDLERNIVSAFLAIKYSVPPMTARGGGAIVCISSPASKMSLPLQASYCTSKAGLEQLIRVSADELGELNIRVNAVRPGLTDTGSDNVRRLLADPVSKAEFLAQRPIGRVGRPMDTAMAVRYLAGPESSWVTGQSLGVDGGHELRRGGSYVPIAKARYGEEAVDAALSGRLPG